MAHTSLRLVRRTFPPLLVTAFAAATALGCSPHNVRNSQHSGDHAGMTFKVHESSSRKSPAGPISSGPSSEQNRATMLAQIPLVAAATRLQQTITKVGRPGAAGTTISVADKQVQLYWKGNLPVPIAQAVKSLSRHGAEVVVRPARYSFQQMQKQASDLIRHARAYPGLHRVSLLPDGSGLEVGVSLDSQTAAFRQLPVATHVAVEEPFEPFQCNTGHSYCRLHDTPRYWGGAAISVGDCSDAFATISTLSFIEPGPSGPITVRPKYMLTANHCGGGVGVNYFAGSGGLMGQGALTNRDVDSVAIRTDSAPRVYDGGVNDGSEFSKPVVGLGSNFTGEFVCSSGAATGVHCGIQIKNISTSLDWGDHWSYDVVIADQVDGVLAAGKGDSGGPVFTLASDASKVIGLGVINGGGTQADFPASCTYKSATCSTRLFYTDLLQILIKDNLYLLITS